jgi:hypothetical protein
MSVNVLVASLGGLLIWAVYFGLSYAMQTTFCALAGPAWSENSLRLFELVLSGTAVTALLGFLGWQIARLAGHRDRDNPPVARWLRRVSIGMGAFALLGVVWGIPPILMLTGCNAAT